MIDADHVKCNKEELLECKGLFEAWKLGVINALDQVDNPPPIDDKCDCFHKEYGKALCYGTKEREPCSCGGKRSKCNFYNYE